MKVINAFIGLLLLCAAFGAWLAAFVTGHWVAIFFALFLSLACLVFGLRWSGGEGDT